MSKKDENLIIGAAIGLMIAGAFGGVLWIKKLPETIHCSRGESSFGECSKSTWNESVAQSIEALYSLRKGKSKPKKKAEEK